MKPVLHRGKLVTWKDDRGFGFITPDSGGKEVFLHITAVKGANRRPQVGDVILYECVAEADGKVRASKALIQGLVQKSATYTPKPRSPQSQRAVRQPFSRRSRNQQQGPLATIASVVFVIVMALILRGFSPSRSPSPIASITQPNCTIKGNISQTGGTRYYHLPGMEDYENTVIDPAMGEKWFCSEQEAIANGWQKAPR